MQPRQIAIVAGAAIAAFGVAFGVARAARGGGDAQAGDAPRVIELRAPQVGAAAETEGGLPALKTAPQRTPQAPNRGTAPPPASGPPTTPVSPPSPGDTTGGGGPTAAPPPPPPATGGGGGAAKPPARRGGGSGSGDGGVIVGGGED
jgi:hypothetical protein